MLQVAFGQGSDATHDSPRFSKVRSVAISKTAGVRVALVLENAAGLKLLPARVCEKIKPYPAAGQTCCEVPGLLVLNATMSDGRHAWINGTVMVSDEGQLIGEWQPPCELHYY